MACIRSIAAPAAARSPAVPPRANKASSLKRRWWISLLWCISNTTPLFSGRALTTDAQKGSISLSIPGAAKQGRPLIPLRLFSKPSDPYRKMAFFSKRQGCCARPSFYCSPWMAAPGWWPHLLKGLIPTDRPTSGPVQAGPFLLFGQNRTNGCKADTELLCKGRRLHPRLQRGPYQADL